MPEKTATTRILPGFWTAVRNPEVEPDWNLTVVVVAALLIGIAVAVGLGDAGRVVYTMFPALFAVAIGLSAGAGPAVAVAGVTVALLTIATAAAATPLTAAVVFGAVLLWLTVPSRVRPSPALAPLLQLAYFVVAAFGTPGTTVLRALVLAAAGALAGLLTVLGVRAVRKLGRHPDASAEPPASDGSEPSSGETPPSNHTSKPLAPGQAAGYVLGALVSAALLYWRLGTDSQHAAWVLLTFILVFQPTAPTTLARSLGRVGGTVVGFALVMMLAILPEQIGVALGLAAIAPSIAYSRRDYVVSVAATTIVVVTVYGSPAGDYLEWGLARTLDTGVGAAIAVALSAVVRRLERPALSRRGA